MDINKQNNSNNIYESLFHPLLYKKFQCKYNILSDWNCSVYQKNSDYCPFYHNE